MAASPGSAPTSPKSSPATPEAQPGVAIRRAGPPDIAALGALAEAAFGPYVALLGRRPQPLDMDFADALASKDVWVARDGEGVCGYLVAHRVAGATGFIEAVGVAPRVRGRGIGPRLIAIAEDAARRDGARTMTLYTNLRMTQNLRLYPRLGYVETGRTVTTAFAHVDFAKALPPPIAVKPAVDALYGRRRVHGHGIAPDYRRLALDIDAPADLGALFPTARAIRLEVGFGGGEHLITHATAAPDVALIGVEPFETGMMRAVRAVLEAGLANVRLHLGDARRVLEWLPPGALERVDVLYPDPWHKQRHWKRRFISAEGLGRLARAIGDGGEVRFASDIAHYVAWTRTHVAAHPAFKLERDAAEPWPAWPGTRYEEKALREGRAPRYLTLRRAARG